MTIIPSDFFFHFTVVSVSALVLWLGVTGVDRWRIRWYRSTRTPRALFGELCRAHLLSRADRRSLAQIARDVSSDDYCRVFIDRRLIDQFASRHPEAAHECRSLTQKRKERPACNPKRSFNCSDYRPLSPR